MKKPTLSFDQIPEAISLLLDKVSAIDQRLEQYQHIASPKDDLWNISQAASYLNLTVPTLYTMVSRGRIPYNKISKKLYFSKKQLTEWILSGHRKTRSEIEESGVEQLLKKRGATHV